MKSKVPKEILEKVQFFIPVFLINAHRNSCVSQFHPRNDPSIGEIDGETVERVWSQLAIFSHTTRNMPKGNRTETLEDAFQALRDRVKKGLMGSLRQKLTLMDAKLSLLVGPENLVSF